MYRIEDFVKYDGRKLNNNNAVLTWRTATGYQFMMANKIQDDHIIMAYRP